MVFFLVYFQHVTVMVCQNGVTLTVTCMSRRAMGATAKIAATTQEGRTARFACPTTTDVCLRTDVCPVAVMKWVSVCICCVCVLCVCACVHLHTYI